MFCFKAGVLLQELQNFAPDIYQTSQKAYQQRVTEASLQRIPMAEMDRIPEQSIDCAVMEQSQLMKVVSVSMGWSDLGSFDSLYEAFSHDLQGNAIVKRGDDSLPIITENSHGNLIMSRNHAIATIDVDDLIIVDTTDAILISKKGSSQKVKKVVAKLKKQQSELTDIHRLAYRPWGSYEVLLGTEKYKIKRIIVQPGRSLSLQKHYHRSEHWVVVSGTAEVTIGQDTFIVRPNESTYIPIGEIHRLENKGKVDLIMIEVQVGEYTGEDDIVRLDDQYGRH
jgi:mannose-1-phosphate guanylyltransferase